MSTTLPSDYIPRFTRDEIRKRFGYFSECCQEYLEFFKSRHPTWELQFDPLVLMNVSISAMDDIWRWKVYHLREPQERRFSDAIKRATYFTKWLVKLRPIHFVNRPVVSAEFLSRFDKEETTLLINEYFAIHSSLSFLATDAKRDKIILAPKTMGRLLYHLHYRDITSDSLMIWYQLVATAAKNELIIMR